MLRMPIKDKGVKKKSGHGMLSHYDVGLTQQGRGL